MKKKSQQQVIDAIDASQAKTAEEARKRDLQSAYEQGYRHGYAGASLWASDEINRLTDMILRSRDEILGKNKELCQHIADRCGRDIHTAVPGVSVHPRGSENPTRDRATDE